MEFAAKKLKEGKIRPIDIPYMQRPGGKPDNSDLTPGGDWKPGKVPKGFEYEKKGGFKLPWQK